MHNPNIHSIRACYKISYHILILTLNKSSILPSFFSKSEFLLFSSADIFSIVRSDYTKRKKLRLVSKYYMSSYFSHYSSGGKKHLLTQIAWNHMAKEIKSFLTHSLNLAFCYTCTSTLVSNIRILKWLCIEQYRNKLL